MAGQPFVFQDTGLTSSCALFSAATRDKTYLDEFRLPVTEMRTGEVQNSPVDTSAKPVFPPFEMLPVLKPDSPRMHFKCPVCGKEFYNKTDFKRHYMTHTGEKPYGCPYCNYRTVKRSDIRGHVNVKHPELANQ